MVAVEDLAAVDLVEVAGTSAAGEAHRMVPVAAVGPMAVAADLTAVRTATNFSQ
jgi:hypothetical protein